MIRFSIRTGAAAVVALGLAAVPTVGTAETAAVPAVNGAASGGSAAAPVAAPVAPPVTAANAAALVATLEGGLKHWFPATGATAAYHWDGAVTVTAAGDHYEVNLPSLQITADDGRVNVGVVRLALVPNADGSWGVGVSVPPQITLVGADDKVEGEFTIGSQTFFGRWLPTIGTFIEADGSYGDLHAVSKKDQSRLDIGAIGLRVALTEQPPGRWTGPSSFEIKQLSMADEHGVVVAKLGGTTIEAAISSMDLARAVALESQAADAKGKAAESRTAVHLAMMHGLFAAASGKFSLSDLSMTSPADNSTVAIGRLVLSGGVEGLDLAKSTLSLGYEHGGLKIEPDYGMRQFMPERVELSVAVADLPNSNLWTAFTQIFDAGNGRTEEQAGQQFAAQSMAALSREGSKLRLNALRIETPAAAANVKGEARFNSKAAMGVVGGVDATLRGLDATIKQLQPAKGGTVDEDAQNTLTMLTMVQAFGAPGKDEAGREIRSYKLELGADGRLLLNGTDMSALMQGGQETAPTPAPGKAKNPASKKGKVQQDD